MREVVRRLRPLLLREADLVVVARARAAGFGYRRMEEDLVRLLTMARLLPR
jgi:RNase P protein component